MDGHKYLRQADKGHNFEASQIALIGKQKLDAMNQIYENPAFKQNQRRNVENIYRLNTLNSERLLFKQEILKQKFDKLKAIQGKYLQSAKSHHFDRLSHQVKPGLGLNLKARVIKATRTKGKEESGIHSELNFALEQVEAGHKDTGLIKFEKTLQKYLSNSGSKSEILPQLLQYSCIKNLPADAYSQLEELSQKDQMTLTSSLSRDTTGNIFELFLKNDNFKGLNTLMNYMENKGMSSAHLSLSKFRSSLEYYLNSDFNIQNLIVFMRFYTHHYESKF